MVGGKQWRHGRRALRSGTRGSKVRLVLSFKTTLPNNGANQAKPESTPVATGFSAITVTATPIKETRTKINTILTALSNEQVNPARFSFSRSSQSTSQQSIFCKYIAELHPMGEVQSRFFSSKAFHTAPFRCGQRSEKPLHRDHRIKDPFITMNKAFSLSAQDASLRRRAPAAILKPCSESPAFAAAPVASHRLLCQ